MAAASDALEAALWLDDLHEVFPALVAFVQR